jgi:hypothetical protein
LKARRVLLYGNNLVMSVIAARLQEKPEFEISQIQGFIPDMIEKLGASPPDVIVFDSAAGQPQFAIPLLNLHPALVLIGVDLTSSKMLVLSGQQSRFLTAEDLLKVIEVGET